MPKKNVPVHAQWPPEQTEPAEPPGPVGYQLTGPSSEQDARAHSVGGGGGVLWDPSFTDGCEKTGSGGFVEEPEQPGHLCVPVTAPQDSQVATDLQGRHTKGQAGRQEGSQRATGGNLVSAATESLR